MMRSIGLRLFGALVCVAAGLGGASAADFRLGNRTLAVEPPAGYCAMDRRAPLEGPLFEAQEKASPTIRVLALHVDCRKLDAYRGEEAYLEDLAPSILVLASLHEGEPMVVGLPREQFNEAMEVGMRSITESQVQEMATQSSETLLAVLKEKLGPHYADIRYVGTQYLGILGRDETAVYMGQIAKLSLAGTPWTETAVSASTLVNGVVITVSYAEPGDRPEAVGDILTQVRQFTRDLIALNEGNL
jgi:hypothetical protein